MAVRMIQLTSREEWLKKRTSYVGGSEAAALVGKNPYMTNIDLYRIKTGQQAKENIDNKDYVIYGHNAEPHLRELFAPKDQKRHFRAVGTKNIGCTRVSATVGSDILVIHTV